MRTVSVRIWSLAASTTPGATDNGFCLRCAGPRGLPPAQAVRFDKPLDGGLTQPGCLRRCRCLVPQIEKPIRGEVVSELEHLGVIAPELLTHAAGQTSALPAAARRSSATTRAASQSLARHSTDAERRADRCVSCRPARERRAGHLWRRPR